MRYLLAIVSVFGVFISFGDLTVLPIA